MTDQIEFEVRGIPIQQGSGRAFIVGRGTPKQRAIVTHDSRRDLGGWRRLISNVAQGSAPEIPWDGPVGISLGFRLPQPASRPTTRGRGRSKVRFRIWPDRTPDLDKLIRAAIDSLTGIVFDDDKRVVEIHAAKDYGVPGLRVAVWRVVDGSTAPSPAPAAPSA